MQLPPVWSNETVKLPIGKVDVDVADYFFELRLMNQPGGLLARAAENQRSIASVQLTADLLGGEQKKQN